MTKWNFSVWELHFPNPTILFISGLMEVSSLNLMFQLIHQIQQSVDSPDYPCLRVPAYRLCRNGIEFHRKFNKRVPSQSVTMFMLRSSLQIVFKSCGQFCLLTEVSLHITRIGGSPLGIGIHFIFPNSKTSSSELPTNMKPLTILPSGAAASMLLSLMRKT